MTEKGPAKSWNDSRVGEPSILRRSQQESDVGNVEVAPGDASTAHRTPETIAVAVHAGSLPVPSFSAEEGKQHAINSNR